MDATFIFPHQLFRNHPALQTSRITYLIQDPLFFGDKHYPLSFHKQARKAAKNDFMPYLESFTEGVFFSGLAGSFSKLCPPAAIWKPPPFFRLFRYALTTSFFFSFFGLLGPISPGPNL